jgi:hypothetical protein
LEGKNNQSADYTTQAAEMQFLVLSRFYITKGEENQVSAPKKNQKRRRRIVPSRAARCFEQKGFYTHLLRFSLRSSLHVDIIIAARTEHSERRLKEHAATA